MSGSWRSARPPTASASACRSTRPTSPRIPASAGGPRPRPRPIAGNSPRGNKEFSVAVAPRYRHQRHGADDQAGGRRCRHHRRHGGKLPALGCSRGASWSPFSKSIARSFAGLLSLLSQPPEHRPEAARSDRLSAAKQVSAAPDTRPSAPLYSRLTTGVDQEQEMQTYKKISRGRREAFSGAVLA